MTSLEPIQKVAAWHEFHKRARSPFFTGYILGAPGIQREGFPFDHRIKDFGMFCDHVTVSKAEKLALREKALGYLADNPEFLTELMGGAYRAHAAAIARWKEANARDLSALPQADFAEEFARYGADLDSFGIYVTLPLFVEDHFEEVLKEEFGKRFGEEAGHWFGIAVNPVRDGTVLDEEVSRLKLTKGDTAGLAKHAEAFGWMANTGFFEEYYDASYYQKLIDEEKENPQERLEELLDSRAQHRAAFNELLGKLADDPILSALVRTANEAVFFRSYRTEMFYSSPAYNQPLFAETAKRFGLASSKELVWLYGKEVLDLLRAGVQADKALIARRKDAYCYLSGYDGSFYSWDGDDAKDALAAYQGVEAAHEAVSEIKGSGAFLGTVQGKVVVLANASEAGKVQGGEILVTHATNVDFVPVLRKVAAIVTEEGGILSHAAIISRELRIPCVIGTKIATKVFKDGDMVEVDAKAGIVRRI